MNGFYMKYNTGLKQVKFVLGYMKYINVFEHYLIPNIFYFITYPKLYILAQQFIFA